MKCVEKTGVDGCEGKFMVVDGKCISCHEGFYHQEDGTCLKNTVDNCLVTSLTSNTCIKCYLGFLVNTAGDECIKLKDHCV